MNNTFLMKVKSQFPSKFIFLLPQLLFVEHDLLDTQKLIEEMEKISISNEKMLTAQICLLMDDNCQPNIAAEYCSYKMKNPEKYCIKAKKVAIKLIQI